MIEVVAEECAKVGLKVHPAKTHILISAGLLGKRCAAMMKTSVGDITILKPTQSAKYLGRQVRFPEPHLAEAEHRIKCRWAKFHANRHILCNSRISSFSRLKLFHAVVTPSVLYGSRSLTMSGSIENMVRKTQR